MAEVGLHCYFCLGLEFGLFLSCGRNRLRDRERQQEHRRLSGGQFEPKRKLRIVLHAGSLHSLTDARLCAYSFSPWG